MKQKTPKKKIEWKKVATVEQFTLHQMKSDPTVFSVRWMKPDGKYGSRRFSAPTATLALKEAPVKAGLKPASRKKQVRLVDAFNEVLSQTSRGPKSTSDWRYYVKRFLRWLAAKHPDCRYWHLLTRRIIREYLTTFEGKSNSMRRLGLQPISQSSGYMHREYGYVHFAERLGIGVKLEKTPPKVYLEDVAEFLRFLVEKKPRLAVGVALQGLAGLQVQEVTRLTWDKVDLENGLVEISGKVKNVYRNRVIPVAASVLDILRDEKARQNDLFHAVQEIRGHVLLSERGVPYESWWQNYTKAVQRLLAKWNPKIDWKTKDFRNCLPTFALMQGLQSDVWEQYIGHVPQSITAKHYIPRLASASLGENNALEGQMKVFRTHVTEPVNQAIEGAQSSEILNFFELQSDDLRISSK